MSQFKLVMTVKLRLDICFHLIFEVYLIKLHWNVYILFTVHVVFAGRLVCSVNVLYI